MTTGQIFRMPLEWMPKPFKWQNYPQALTAMPFFRYLFNTLIVLFFVEAGDRKSVV